LRAFSLTHLPERPCAADDDGFSIVEVIVGMMVLVVAVLGTFVLVEGGIASTKRTTAREQGTSLARDLVERSRQIAYANTTSALAPAALRATLPAADTASAVTGSQFTVKRRGITYTVAVTACTVDDPADGAGVGDSSFCLDDATTGVPSSPSGTPTPTPAPGLTANVLGVQVSAAGTLIDTVCGALGNPTLLAELTSGVSSIAPVSICPAGGGVGGRVNYDSQPDDLRRVRVNITWTANDRAESLTQTTLLPNPAP
jgi:Tfp pilus assembly protein PilV